MPTLTAKEADVRDVVKHLYDPDDPLSEGVSAESIRVECQTRFYQHYVSYDIMFQALRSLVEKGILTKPKRGYYRPC